jgi:hypothetical protein
MHINSIPTWALPLSNTSDFATTPACGDLIQVSTYSITNAAGAGNVPTNEGYGRLLILPFTQTGQVSLRLLDTSGQWYNFNKQFHQFIANQTTWLSGTVTAAACSGCWIALWISAAYADQNATVIHIIANFTIDEATPFVKTFVVPNDGVLYTQLGFTFGSLPIFSTITLTDVLATSNSSILNCMLNTQAVPQMTEAPSSEDSGAPLRVCIFTKGQQIYYNAPGIGQCFCDKDTAGAGCNVPALPVPYAPGRTIIKAACGGFSSNQGLALARDGSLQPVDVDGAYFDGNIRLLECKCRDLGLVMRSTFLQASPFSDQNLYRVDGAYGQPEFSDAIINNTATNQAGNICSNKGGTLPYIVFPQDGENWLATWKGGPVVSGLTMISQGVFQWGDTQFITSPQLIEPCPGTFICGVINYNDLAYGQNGAWTDGSYAPVPPTPSPLPIPLSRPTASPASGTWTIQFRPNSGDPDLTTRASPPTCGGASEAAGGYGVITCTGTVNSFALSNSATLSLSEVQVYTDGARV